MRNLRVRKRRRRTHVIAIVAVVTISTLLLLILLTTTRTNEVSEQSPDAAFGSHQGIEAKPTETSTTTRATIGTTTTTTTSSSSTTTTTTTPAPAQSSVPPPAQTNGPYDLPTPIPLEREKTYATIPPPETPPPRVAAPGEEAFADYYAALNTFYTNLAIRDVGGNPDQPSKAFVDIDSGPLVPVPYNRSFAEDPRRWEACDARNASFSASRDKLCQEYLRNFDNVRFVKAMSSRLMQGRTIKVKLLYAHDNITTIVKISQRKFFFEAASEYWAFLFDRALQFLRIPITVYVPLPLDYLRAATAYSPLLSQWFHRYVVIFSQTNENFVPCSYLGTEKAQCTWVSSQVWMKDVHPTTETFLALPFELDDAFIKKYYVPGHPNFAATKKARLRSVSELLDRVIFDFLIGNSDRGLNNHNNFVYGGCSERTECRPPTSEADRIKGLARYAYIDHGSSLYSHKELETNPFAGNPERIKICRFRSSTYEHLRQYAPPNGQLGSLMRKLDRQVPVDIYRVSHESVLKKVQLRAIKVVGIVDECLKKYARSEVFSLPEYDQVRIYEEDKLLGDEYD